MPTVREIVFPLANYPSGIRQINSRPIPDGVNEIYFEFARCTNTAPTIWANAATQIKYDQEYSLDGGATWIAGGGFTAEGGARLTPDGVQGPLTKFVTSLPPGINRLIRAAVQIVKGPLRTQGAIEFRESAVTPQGTPLHSSPTLDAGDGTKATGTYVTSLTTPAWTCAGTNRYLCAGMAWADIPLTENYSVMRWGGSGGTALTQIGTTLNVTGDVWRVAAAGLIAPATGSNTLYGALSAGPYDFMITGATWTGVHQTTPIGTSASATGTGTTPTVNVSSETDGTVTDFCTGPLTLTKHASQTLINQEDITDEGGFGNSYEAGAATVTMSWTCGSGNWGIIGVPIKAAAVAGLIIPPFLKKENVLLRR